MKMQRVVIMEVLLSTRNHTITFSESIKKENVKQELRNKRIWWLYLISYYKE